MHAIRFVVNALSKEEASYAYLTEEAGRNALRYFEEIPGYAPTPLVSLGALAKAFGVASVYVKDESKRFGLNSFKSLGGGYAMGAYLAELSGISGPLRFKDVKNGIREKRVFATATDGNHGRGVAWAAQMLGHKAVVYMPRGADTSRVEAIRAFGAECTVTGMSYDDTVAYVFTLAAKNRWTAIQDTAFDGYAEIPAWIMQGYCAMGVEILEQLAASGAGLPTHVFLQAGVGSFAAAILGYFKNVLGDAAPVAAILEPHYANCLFVSARTKDKRLCSVSGNPRTIMAGLDCGTPSTLAWKILRAHARHFISCPEYIAANGMRILAAPLDGDPPICSGESGAVGMGVLEYIARQVRGTDLRRSLGIDDASRILLISTEGDTAPQNYRDIVWKGKHPQPLPAG